MAEPYDVLIVGAGTAGTYFGWQMAKKGHSVLIIERDPRDKVGKRLDVFHLDSGKLVEFELPVPEPNSPDFCLVLERSTSYSPEGRYPKVVKYPFHVMRHPLFLQRLFGLAEEAGVDFRFSTTFTELTYEDGRICGARVKQGDDLGETKARLVVDASGIGAAVRTSLPEDYGVENFKVGADDKFYVVLRYITWLDPDQPRTTDLDGWTYFKTWVAPSYHERGALIGVGATGSYDRAEESLREFFRAVELPPYRIDRTERGITPYRRPPYSLVGDGFICMGDSACLTKPFSGEGITSAWTLCKIAVDVVDEALIGGEYVRAQALWRINVRYFRDQGAKFAAILATVPSAANATRKENRYLFSKDVIFSEEDLCNMNRDFEVHMTTGKILKIFSAILTGMLTGNYSFASFKALLRSVLVSGKIRDHYESYPEDSDALGDWTERADHLWQKAGARMK
jgi:electron-transferring-flavoprotein dehydrogenase